MGPDPVLSGNPGHRVPISPATFKRATAQWLALCQARMCQWFTFRIGAVDRGARHYSAIGAAPFTMGIMKSVPTWFRARVAGKRPIWAALAFSTPLDVWAFAALLKAGGSEWMEAAPRRIHDAQQEAWAWGERTRWRDVDGFALVGALVDAQAIRTGLVSARRVCEGLTGALADQARRAPEVFTG